MAVEQRELRSDVIDAVAARAGALIADDDETDRAVEAGVVLMAVGLLLAARAGVSTDANFYAGVDAVFAGLQKDDVWELLKVRGEIDDLRARFSGRGEQELTRYLRDPANGLVVAAIKEKV